MKRLSILTVCVVYLTLTSSLVAGELDQKKRVILPAAAAGKIDFRRDILPLFQARCIKCHKKGKARSGLRLDAGAAAMKGGNSGKVIKPGHPRQSRLLLVVSGNDAEVKMPPGKTAALTAAEIGRLRAWIEQGAVWPNTIEQTATKTENVKHWAYQPIHRPTLPTVANQTWLKNPIDAFVLAKLEKENIQPSPVAHRATLIRRLSLDLLGLPPSPDQVEAFLNDKRSDAFEKLVDRLLASQHYGERWGRHWLDLARYADSDGYEQDRPRPHAWRYRDWVINALNKNMPFDQFTIEQLAGDLLPKTTVDQKIATGFHRNTLTNNEGGTDKEQFRVEACVDRVNTTAQVWLGLTLGCAQCHDHKYDPFSQREYYQFLAFFNSDVEVNVPLRRLKKAKQVAMTLALGNRRKTHVLIRGDFLRHGVEVEANTPEILSPMKTTAEKRTRLHLAKWLVSADNRLTPRVVMNWMWARHFGRGIVATPEDFGVRGEKPSHPKLLDYLADEFVRQKWNLKAMHKFIVTSATYRQASIARPELAERDPNNLLLARQNRFRLEAEIIRDTALAASGLLTPVVGGPSVKPPQPKGVSEITYAGRAKWTAATGPNRFRRGMYTWLQRTSPFPMLMTFDAPDTTVCVVRRERSNTPLQALTLLNDTVFVECAQALGKRILTNKSKASTEERLRFAFRACLARTPDDHEMIVLTRLYDNLRTMCHADPKEAARLAGKVRVSGVDVVETAAWVALGRALLNLDEFITRE